MESVGSVVCVTMRRDLSQVRCYRDGVRCNASMLTPSGIRRVTYITGVGTPHDVLSRRDIM